MGKSESCNWRCRGRHPGHSTVVVRGIFYSVNITIVYFCCILLSLRRCHRSPDKRLMPPQSRSWSPPLPSCCHSSSAVAVEVWWCRPPIKRWRPPPSGCGSPPLLSSCASSNMLWTLHQRKSALPICDLSLRATTGCCTCQSGMHGASVFFFFFFPMLYVYCFCYLLFQWKNVSVIYLFDMFLLRNIIM